MMKIVKRALRGILGNANVNNEKLSTAICNKESLLNSRQVMITYVTADTNDIAPLTRSHYLCQLRGGFAPDVVDDEATKPQKRGNANNYYYQGSFENGDRMRI